MICLHVAFFRVRQIAVLGRRFCLIILRALVLGSESKQPDKSSPEPVIEDLWVNFTVSVRMRASITGVLSILYLAFGNSFPLEHRHFISCQYPRQ